VSSKVDNNRRKNVKWRLVILCDGTQPILTYTNDIHKCWLLIQSFWSTMQGSASILEQKIWQDSEMLAVNTELLEHNAGKCINFKLTLTEWTKGQHFYAEHLELNDLKIWKIIYRHMHVCVRELWSNIIR
jgi:hypothetical protein